MIEKPYPTLQTLLEMMGDAGRRMCEIDASEGAAGNISVCARWDLNLKELFPIEEKVTLPQIVPELVGATIIVSGSGRRLRELGRTPTANVACLVVDEGGVTATQYSSPNRVFQKVTTEFNSHLAVHSDRVLSTNTNFHAVIHAQPPYLTFLSQIPRYQDFNYLNRHVLRWQPETIVQLSEGIGFEPFKLPGSTELVKANAELLRTHRVVVWAKHGVMACSDISIKRAADRIEYAETGARYEYLNLTVGEIAEGLSLEEIRSICSAFHIQQSIF
ncbi:MAG: class II aldolase/adducin family protein [Anaerolineaceae bacterium]|nr:class II aldolase/adducin family protein [Anaerolineaceae bacterium]